MFFCDVWCHFSGFFFASMAFKKKKYSMLKYSVFFWCFSSYDLKKHQNKCRLQMKSVEKMQNAIRLPVPVPSCEAAEHRGSSTTTQNTRTETSHRTPRPAWCLTNNMPPELALIDNLRPHDFSTLESVKFGTFWISLLSSAANQVALLYPFKYCWMGLDPSTCLPFTRLYFLFIWVEYLTTCWRRNPSGILINSIYMPHTTNIWKGNTTWVSSHFDTRPMSLCIS